MWQLIFVGVHRNRPRRIFTEREISSDSPSLASSNFKVAGRPIFRVSSEPDCFCIENGVDYFITNIRINSCSNVYDRPAKAIQIFSCLLSGATAVSKIVCSVEFSHGCVEWKICSQF